MTQVLEGAQWQKFTAVRHRSSNNGLAMMPTAGPYPQVASVVALNGGLEFDRIFFVASKRGEPPTIPAPWTSNPNRVFLRGEQSTPFPMPELNGVKTYGVCGFYEWGILSPEGLESDFMIGTVPFPGLDKDERIPAAYFSYDSLNQTLTRVVDGKNSIPELSDELQLLMQLQFGDD